MGLLILIFKSLERVEMSRKKSVVAKKSKKRVASRKFNEVVPLWKKILPPSILVFLTWIFYYPSLRYAFQFDDLANITKNFKPVRLLSFSPLSR